MFILSQVLGGIALVIICTSYFLQVKKTFLLFQIAANFFYGCSFLALGSFVAGLITLVSLIRCIFLFYSDKLPVKCIHLVLPLFIACYIAIAVIFWSGWLDIIPIFTAICFTYAFSIKEQQMTRYFCLVPNALLVIYAFIWQAYLNAILDLIEIIVLVCAIIKFHRKQKNKSQSFTPGS